MLHLPPPILPALLTARAAPLLPRTRIELAAPDDNDYASRTDSEWRQVLSPAEFDVLRNAGTERPWTSPLNELEVPGVLVCAACNSPLFRMEQKFESGSGWPSFWAPAGDGAVKTQTDFKLLVPRTEVLCPTCGGHLGHRFSDGPMPTGQRFCINGVALKHVSEEEAPALAARVADSYAASTSARRPPLEAVLPELVLGSLLVVGELLRLAAPPWAAGSLALLPPGGIAGAVLLAFGATVVGRNAFLLAVQFDTESEPAEL